MHWAEENVNPLLALRNAICNDRWEECWAVIEQGLRRKVVLRRQGRRAQRALAKPPKVEVGVVPAPVPVSVVEPPRSPAQPEAKQGHPWCRPWSVRRQRDLAGAA